MSRRAILSIAAVSALLCGNLFAAESPGTRVTGQWTVSAWAWQRQQPWIVGFNYVPSTAANTTEFWSRETFDEKTIDRELGWGGALGFNSCRVFVQYLVWKSDPDGLKQRLEQVPFAGQPTRSDHHPGAVRRLRNLAIRRRPSRSSASSATRSPA